jgi:hypothetical protein
MTSIGSDLKHVLVTERELWSAARRTSCSSALRRQCPVHWTERITEFPGEARVLVGHDGRTTSTP